MEKENEKVLASGPKGDETAAGENSNYGTELQKGGGRDELEEREEIFINPHPPGGCSLGYEISTDELLASLEMHLLYKTCMNVRVRRQEREPAVITMSHREIIREWAGAVRLTEVRG
ncbi:unnamed protein product [Pleuronectes platessa]|uniref:Uncharacterized protein n=1 Tax=Pleuronectes platessa TaxID=8262 RepID=A0A9N7TTD6_PLEPL|nr:unnamed protein product [Pleuronectes platessa]